MGWIVTTVASGFAAPTGVAVLPDGSIAVADQAAHAIKLIAAGTGEVTTLAGSGVKGCVDGRGTAAEFHAPHSVAVMSDGTLLVADSGNHRLRRVTRSGSVDTVAGSANPGYSDGAALGGVCAFTAPHSVAVAPGASEAAGDTVFVAESGSGKLRKLRFAASVDGALPVPGSVSTVNDLKFDDPQHLVFTGAAGVARLYVAGTLHVDVVSGDALVAGAAGAAGAATEGALSVQRIKDSACFAQSVAACPADPLGVEVYVLAKRLSALRRVSADGSGTSVSVAGDQKAGDADGSGESALFNCPAALCVDPKTGDVLVCDTGNGKVKRLRYAGGADATQRGLTQSWVVVDGAASGSGSAAAAAAANNATVVTPLSSPLLASVSAGTSPASLEPTSPSDVGGVSLFAKAAVREVTATTAAAEGLSELKSALFPKAAVRDPTLATAAAEHLPAPAAAAGKLFAPAAVREATETSAAEARDALRAVARDATTASVATTTTVDPTPASSVGPTPASSSNPTPASSAAPSRTATLAAAATAASAAASGGSPARAPTDVKQAEPAPARSSTTAKAAPAPVAVAAAADKPVRQATETKEATPANGAAAVASASDAAAAKKTDAAGGPAPAAPASDADSAAGKKGEPADAKQVADEKQSQAKDGDADPEDASCRTCKNDCVIA